MTSFRCLGPECSDDCCHGWSVIVDRRHWELLSAALPPDELERGLARAEGDDPRRHALTVLDEGGRCSFLDGAGWCTIQARFGEELLPDGCATFPRVVGRLGERVELAGRVSCPEVVRLALLVDDAALDLVGAPPQPSRRGLTHHLLDDADDYDRAFALVRDLLLDLLRSPGSSIAARLFNVAFFADRTRRFLRRGGARMAPGQLQAIVLAARDPRTIEQLDADLEERTDDPPFPLSVVRAILLLPADVQPGGLGRLIAELRGAGVPLSGDAAALHAAYRSQPPPPAWVLERLDVVVARYARHFVLREWFTDAPSLVGYVFGLLARIAVIRFLVLAHPAPRAPGFAPADLDALVVRAIVSLTRLLEHNRPLAQHIVAALEEQGMTEIDHAALLLKV